MHKIKTEDVYKDFSSDKKMFNDSNKLVIGKMKDETGGAAIFGLKPKMYSFLVDDNSKHKKAKDVNRNVVAAISPNKYKMH